MESVVAWVRIVSSQQVARVQVNITGPARSSFPRDGPPVPSISLENSRASSWIRSGDQIFSRSPSDLDSATCQNGMKRAGMAPRLLDPGLGCSVEFTRPLSTSRPGGGDETHRKI